MGEKYSMKRRILLVDDDVAVLLTLKAVLEMHGFDVQTASSVSEAINKLEASSYHMVITDMRMETETAGWKVVQAAREQEYRPATAILTAYPPPESNWQDRGAQSLLVKPIGTRDLVRQIEALLVNHEDEKQSRPLDHSFNSARPGLRPASKNSRKVS